MSKFFWIQKIRNADGSFSAQIRERVRGRDVGEPEDTFFRSVPIAVSDYETEAAVIAAAQMAIAEYVERLEKQSGKTIEYEVSTQMVMI